MHGDVHEKFIFLKIQDLRPLNSYQNYFEKTLLHFPLDECEIQGKYTVVYNDVRQAAFSFAVLCIISTVV